MTRILATIDARGKPVAICRILSQNSYKPDHSRLSMLRVGGAPRILLLAVLLLSIGCASLPKDYPRTPSAAFEDHASTAPGSQLAKAAARHTDESGFAIIRHGCQAFSTRIVVTELAEKTLDVRYYI